MNNKFEELKDTHKTNFQIFYVKIEVRKEIC